MTAGLILAAGESRTEKLLEKSLGIVTGLLKLAKSPFLRPVRKTAIELLQAISEEPAHV